MPSYAVLGATGATGSELVKILITRDVKLHLYARSEQRLRDKFPDLPSRVSVHVGQIKDVQILIDCVRGVDVVFATAATNHSSPTNRIARDTAEGLIAAINALKREGLSAPKIVFLSSLSLNTDMKGRGFGSWVLYQAEYYVYEDVRIALETLRKANLQVVEVQPGALAEGRGVGSKIIEGSRINEVDPKTFMTTYQDLASAMLDASDRQGSSYVVYSLNPDGVHPDWARLFRENLVPGLICSWARPLWYVGLWLGLWSA